MKNVIPMLLLAACSNGAMGEERIRVEFNRDVRPILSDKCFYCHGFDEKNRKAGLRLDTAEGAKADLGGYRAVVPGSPESSELIRRIHAKDPDDLMPPPETEQALTPAEKETLARWIAQGADYQEHWAWSELKRPEVPVASIGVSPVDAFLEKGWEAEGVTPASLATPRERLRRLSLDLRGLAPSFEEVSAFEKNPSDEAFLQIRDRWMSEIAYAENQALGWLDLVRWADTSGFVSDEPIASGAYRAWVVRSFLHNQRFDQFSMEQLAGDLLPDPTDDQLIASGYNRILNTNCEAGAIETEQLYKLKGEHVRALGTVWLGMTTGCAECHDHKFDPFSAKDYYSLAAFFDDLVEAGVYTPGDRREPLHYVHDRPADRKRDKVLSGKIARLKDEIYSFSRGGSDAWEEEVRKSLSDKDGRTDYIWIPGELPAVRVLEGGFTKVKDVERGWVRETRAAEGELRRHHAAETMTGYLHQKSLQTDPKTDGLFVDAWIDPDSTPEWVGFQVSHGDYGRLGWKTANYETYYWGNAGPELLKEAHAWSEPGRVRRMGELPDTGGWVRLRVPFDQQIKPASGQSFEAVGVAWLHEGGRVRWGGSGAEIRVAKALPLRLGETGIRKWWDVPFNRQFYQRRMELVASAVRKAARDRDEVERMLVRRAWQEAVQPERMGLLRKLEGELHELRSQAMPVLVSRKAKEPKTTRVLNRGDYQDTTGPLVMAAVPDALAGGEDLGEELDRLDLARWLFDGNRALVARVYVNRLWHQFYGRGLSETLEDAGTQGDWPSHVGLLDWLACEFIESGWDRNHMVRILTSARSYQLDSKPSRELVEKDPGNRLHARQGRYRLAAEAIRDNALKAAGLLQQSGRIPERSFFPYQPAPYWTRSDKVMFGSRHMDWDTSEEEIQYVRSLYTFWKRQNIHPTMLAFDAPTRQECTARRNITNTPGQALALLNDPIFVEAARGIAQRVMGLEGGSSERITQLFELVLQRRPSGSEAAVVTDLLSRQRSHFKADEDAAGRFLSIGNLGKPQDMDTIELAAWTAVARAVLNLHEFVNRS